MFLYTIFCFYINCARLLHCFQRQILENATIWGHFGANLGLKSFRIPSSRYRVSPLGGGVRQRRAELPRRHAGVVRHAVDGGGGAHREGDPIYQLALPAAPRRHRQAVWHQGLHDDAPGFSEYRQETQGWHFVFCAFSPSSCFPSSRSSVMFCSRRCPAECVLISTVLFFPAHLFVLLFSSLLEPVFISWFFAFFFIEDL